MKKNSLIYTCALLASAAALNAGALGQEKTEAGADHKIVRSGDLKWAPIMKGCDLAPVSGDPGADGTAFVLRIRCVDGVNIPAHWHPTDESLNVLKGTFLVGRGEKFEETKLTTMNVGNFALMPKEMRHYARCKGETIVQVHGTGPFKVNWVNPAEVIPPDAPAGATAKPKS